MEIKYFVGIDFGHGETTVSRAPGYNGEPVSQVAIRLTSDDKVKKIISAVGRKDDQWTLVYGDEDYKMEDLREGFKRRVSEMTDKDKESMREFAKLVFEAILKNDTELEYSSEEERNFVLGIACPSGWGKDDCCAQQEYLHFFRNECGLPVDLCIKESDAAFFSKYKSYDEDDNVFVIDLGSSTIDFTTYARRKCVADLCWGENFGAHLIDDILIKRVLNTEENADRIKNVKEFKQSLGVADGVEAALSLFVRKCKEDFFTNNNQLYYLQVNYSQFCPWPGSVFQPCVQYSATREEFDEIISEYKMGIIDVLSNAKIKLNQNGISPNKVLLSGGACRMPFIKSCTEKIFGVKVDVDHLPECVVSNGIALYSKSRKELEDKVRDRLLRINYSDLYISSDRKATAKATQDLFPNVLNKIQGNEDLSGSQMFSEIASFFLGLNSSNEKYKKIFTDELNVDLSTRVASYIKGAISEVYNRDMNDMDIKVHIEPIIMCYPFEFFSEGNGGLKIYRLLEEATGPHIITSFDTNKTRSASVRSIIAKKCREKLCTGDPFGIGYENDGLNAVTNDIKEQCLSQAMMIINSAELFETTYILKPTDI